MFFKRSQEAIKVSSPENDEFLEALRINMPTISFLPDGTIMDASPLFLGVAGYSLEEVKGQHHRIFCDPKYANSGDYKNFWKNLNQGKKISGTFKRLNKAGDTVWLEATYFPILTEGVVTRIFKIASDVTESKASLDNQKFVFNAINRSLGVIEFTPEGHIIQANSNFTETVGYSLDEIRGKHHRMFCTDSFYNENPTFWEELAKGKFRSGKFERKDKHGNILWLEATYNPVFDDDGKVIKVIKFASNITERVEQRLAAFNVTKNAHATAIETVKIAEKGYSVLQNTVSTSEKISSDVEKSSSIIEKLNEQSGEISKIVTTISGIADQTNLLALNAAIEAARAGEQGRGFAVVADEVRSLAGRTSTSTVEIEKMVEQNSSLTREAKESMGYVIEQSEKNTQLVKEASDIIDEIRTGAENVSQSIADLL